LKYHWALNRHQGRRYAVHKKSKHVVQGGTAQTHHTHRYMIEKFLRVRSPPRILQSSGPPDHGLGGSSVECEGAQPPEGISKQARRCPSRDSSPLCSLYHDCCTTTHLGSPLDRDPRWREAWACVQPVLGPSHWERGWRGVTIRSRRIRPLKNRTHSSIDQVATCLDPEHRGAAGEGVQRVATWKGDSSRYGSRLRLRS
jgi:hypothetical protein